LRPDRPDALDHLIEHALGRPSGIDERRPVAERGGERAVAPSLDLECSPTLSARDERSMPRSCIVSAMLSA